MTFKMYFMDDTCTYTHNKIKPPTSHTTMITMLYEVLLLQMVVVGSLQAKEENSCVFIALLLEKDTRRCVSMNVYNTWVK